MSPSAHAVMDKIEKRFRTRGGELNVLAKVGLEVREGEFLSIIGPSGCGKTTLLRLLGGLDEPTSGSVSILGAAPKEAQRKKQIGYVFQDPSLLPWRTVKENIALPLRVNRQMISKGPVKDTASQVGKFQSMVGLDEFAAYYPHQLSGGMKQRVALARALVFDPSLLLMDEPLGSLDELTRGAMRYELLGIWEATRKTVVMVTHSIAEAVLLSDRVAVMTPRPGRIADIINIDLPRPRRAGIERETKFLDYVESIQRLLVGGGVPWTSR